jgi:hypothetical protein
MIPPYQSASWTARLTLYLNLCTGASEQSFGNFFVENFQRSFFLVCFGVQDVCIDNCHVEQMKEKVLPPFYRFPCKRIPYILESNAHPNLMRTQFLAIS